MSVDQLIHFNSNEEYERSVFQFVQMTGNMSIKEAKHAMDGLVERTLAKQNFLTYRCGGGRNRQSSVLYVFDTGYRFQNSRERIFAHTLKNTRREENGSDYYGLFIQRESLLRDDIRSKTGCWHIGDIVFSDMNELNELLGRLAEEALYENWRFTNFQTKITHPILKNYLENTYFQLFRQGKIYINEEEEKMLLNTGLIDASFNELYLVCGVPPDTMNDQLFRYDYRQQELYN